MPPSVVNTDCHMLKSHIIYVELQKFSREPSYSCSFSSKGHLPARLGLATVRFRAGALPGKSRLLGFGQKICVCAKRHKGQRQARVKRVLKRCWPGLIFSVKTVVSDQIKQRQIVSLKNK